MGLFRSPKLLFAVVLCVGVLGSWTLLSRRPAPAASSFGTGGGRGAGAAGGTGGGTDAGQGAAGKSGGQADGRSSDKSPGEQDKRQQKPERPEAPQGFFARLFRRLGSFFSGEGAVPGFFRRLFGFLNIGADRSAAVSPGGRTGPAEAREPGGKPQAGPASAASAQAAELQKQIKDNVQQALDQQKMLREMQQMQRQNLESIRMIMQSQKMVRETTENSKAVLESSKKR